MSTEVLLVTQLHRDSEEAPWQSTTETVAAAIDAPSIASFNKRLVVEAVIYSAAVGVQEIQK